MAAPGPRDVDTSGTWPVKLVNGYCLNGIFGGSNTAFLKVTKKEYSKWVLYPGSDSLYKLILEMDPFVELYFYYDDHKTFNNDNGLDTVKLNNLIKMGRLEKYFRRLK